MPIETIQVKPPNIQKGYEKWTKLTIFLLKFKKRFNSYKNNLNKSITVKNKHLILNYGKKVKRERRKIKIPMKNLRNLVNIKGYKQTKS